MVARSKRSTSRSISSRVMIDILTAMGADRIITRSSFNSNTGFAKIPFDNLYSRSVLFEAIKEEKFSSDTTAVLAPDVGSVKMSQGYAKNLGMHFALIDKRRFAPNQAEVNHLIGDLEGMDVLIIDDMIDTAEQRLTLLKTQWMNVRGQLPW